MFEIGETISCIPQKRVKGGYPIIFASNIFPNSHLIHFDCRNHYTFWSLGFGEKLICTPIFQSLISTIRHELLHALGFSASLYAFYRDENGDPRTPRGDSGKPPIDFDLRVRKWSENTIKTVILKLFFLYLHT